MDPWPLSENSPAVLPKVRYNWILRDKPSYGINHQIGILWEKTLGIILGWFIWETPAKMSINGTTGSLELRGTYVCNMIWTGAGMARSAARGRAAELEVRMEQKNWGVGADILGLLNCDLKGGFRRFNGLSHES